MNTKMLIAAALIVVLVGPVSGATIVAAQGPELPYTYKIESPLVISPDTVTVGSEINNIPTQEDMLRLLNYQLSESYDD